MVAENIVEWILHFSDNNIGHIYLSLMLYVWPEQSFAAKKCTKYKNFQLEKGP